MSKTKRETKDLEKLGLIKKVTYYPMDYRYFENELHWVLFYPKKQQMFLFKEDPPIHKPYFYMRRKLDDDEKGEFDESLIQSTETKIHPLERKEIRLYKYALNSPMGIGRNSPKPEFSKPLKDMTDEEIDEELEDIKLSNFAYENFIEYHTRKEIDLKVTFGISIRFDSVISIFVISSKGVLGS